MIGGTYERIRTDGVYIREGTVGVYIQEGKNMRRLFSMFTAALIYVRPRGCAQL